MSTRRFRGLTCCLFALSALLFFSSSAGCTRQGSTAVRYVDRAKEAGITFRHTDGSSGKYFITETLASGVALFDYDSDGDLDVYFLNGRPLPPGAAPAEWAKDCTAGNALYRNDGPGQNGVPRLTDVTAQAGVPGTGFGVAACTADYDADGDLDLFIAQFGPDVLYRNQGNGTFIDATAQAGVGDPAFGGGCAFGDINNDGYPDLYVSNYCLVDFPDPRVCSTNNVPHYCAPATYTEVPHSLFLNKRDGTFGDASASSGIRKCRGQGLGVLFCDFDQDGWKDIYVANDGDENFLFHNQKNGTFKNIGLEAGVALDMNGDEQGSMGVDIADYDGDLQWDVIVTNYQKQYNAVYHGEGGLLFKDLSFATGIAASSLPQVGWGTRFFDYDNDGIRDLFVANGHLEDHIDKYDQSSTYLQQNQLFKGVGGGKFREVSNECGEGLLLKRSSRGAAFGDLDNDGDVDIAVLCSRDRPLLLMNEGGNRQGWVTLKLVGSAPNRFAFGAVVKLEAGDRRYLDEVRSGGSYASQNDLRLHFGLGGRQVDRVEVRWPSGKVEEISGVKAGRLNMIVEGRGAATDGAALPSQ